MTRVPVTATIEPIISYLSGFFLSTILPQMIVDTMNMPPYAAYTLPNSAMAAAKNSVSVIRGGEGACIIITSAVTKQIPLLFLAYRI